MARCEATTSLARARTLGLPDHYSDARCDYDQGHDGDHTLVWIEPGSGWPGSVVTAKFTAAAPKETT